MLKCLQNVAYISFIYQFYTKNEQKMQFSTHTMESATCVNRLKTMTLLEGLILQIPLQWKTYIHYPHTEKYSKNMKSFLL